MFVSRAEANRRYEKLTAKKNAVGITVSRQGVFQCWKDDSLEYCNYVMYEHGALLYRKGPTFLASDAAMTDSGSIYFFGRHTLLDQRNDGRYQLFGKKHPVADDYSLVTSFRHGEKIVLIIADTLFARQPEFFEFPATSSAERLCLAMVNQVISLRDKTSADKLKLWLSGVHHPLGKLSKRELPAEGIGEESSAVPCEEAASTQQAADEPNLLPCI